MIVSLHWDDFLHSLASFSDAETLVFNEELLRAKELISLILANDISLDEVFDADDSVFIAAYELLSDEPSDDVRLVQDQLQDELAGEGEGGLRSLLRELAKMRGVPLIKEGEFI